MPLLEEIGNNNVQKVHELIVNQDKLPKHEIYLGLIQASDKGYLEIVQIFIEVGIDPNITVWFETPLGKAARNGHLEIVKVLLEGGADVNYLLFHRNSITPLICAVEGENFDIVKILVEAGADVNQTVQGRENALWTAAALGNKEIYNYLAPLTKTIFDKGFSFL